MRPLDWALIQSDWSLYRKRKFQHTQKHQEFESTERPRELHSEKAVCCKRRGEASGETKPADTLVMPPKL